MLPIQKKKVAPPWTKKGKKIESSIRKALYDFEMLPPQGALGLALSGGKDSLTLLFLLKTILGWGFPKLPLYALHVSGEFSCGAGITTQYLQQICDDLEVPLVVKHSSKTLETLECYSCSRERRSLLFEAAKTCGAQTIAFGHHRDDNIQTMLMNLLKKGEFAGNLPKIFLKKYGITLIRPLIYLSENDISIFAKEYDFLRVSCRCPKGQTSMRKKVAEIIDNLEEWFPDVRINLSRATLTYGSDKAARRHFDENPTRDESKHTRH